MSDMDMSVHRPVSGVSGSTTQGVNPQVSPQGTPQGTKVSGVQKKASSQPPPLGSTSAPDTTLPPLRRPVDALDLPKIRANVAGMQQTQFRIDLIMILLVQVFQQVMSSMREGAAEDGLMSLKAGLAAADQKDAEAGFALGGALAGATSSLVGAAILSGGVGATMKIENPIAVSNRLMGYQAGEQISKAMGDMTSGGMGYQTKEEEAEEVRYEAHQQELKAISESDTQALSEARQVAETVLQEAEKMEETHSQAGAQIASSV